MQRKLNNMEKMPCPMESHTEPPKDLNVASQSEEPLYNSAFLTDRKYNSMS